MEEQSEIVRSKKEFAFASSTILSQVGRGIIVHCRPHRWNYRRILSFLN